MKFTKMEGCGNDYVYVDGGKEIIPLEKKPDIVRKLSDRHFGIGGDGVIFINPSDVADFEMEMYNMDGSRSEMCGNGMRCVGKFVYDHRLTDKKELVVVSCGKLKYLTLFVDEDTNTVSSVTVDMGAPILTAKEIPINTANPDMAPVIGEKVCVDGIDYEVTAVSMGNPHAVVFVDEMISDEKMPVIGPKFENHEKFPKRTNTEFIKVVDRKNIDMRVWERGTGETLACGTGACASVVACVLNGFTEDEVKVHLLGGTLNVKYDREKDRVFLNGPATTVFEGEVNI